MHKILGVDVGGSGIKGAIVDVNTGQLLTERFRLLTPQPATPDAMTDTFAELVEHFEWKGVIGCGFPSVIKKGKAYTASNIDKSWIGTNAKKKFEKATGCKVYVANDADVAGVAEMTHGVGKGVKGTVILITIGTGLGSAFFHNGVLIPNTEFGHIQMNGQIAERYASGAVRKRENLSYEVWGTRLNEYLKEIEKLCAPNLIILGGGGSKRFAEIEDVLDLNVDVVPATLRNHAGIIGAAMFGATKLSLKISKAG